MELLDSTPAAGTATVLVDDKGNVLENHAGVPDTEFTGCFTFQQLTDDAEVTPCDSLGVV